MHALERLTAAKNELHYLAKEFGTYGACDPARIEEVKRGGVLAHEATIRWTGNFLSTIYISSDFRFSI